MGRALTRGERDMLLPIFGTTIPYERVKCDVNSHNFGGAGNSITPTGNPYFSAQIYTSDFSADNVPLNAKRVFIHELMHVWQFYHRVNVTQEAVYLFFKCKCDYARAYDYRDQLKTTKDPARFNIEQQADIIADYWLEREVAKLPDSAGSTVNLNDFLPFLAAIRQPYHIPRMEDNAMVETRHETW
jgi:hypothetical protein